jgi:DnaJ-domain-containing protein 1
MEFLAPISDWLFVLAFFGVIFILSCWLLSSMQLGWPSRRLACLLEDAPEEVLKGQAYELSIPLLTPLACQLEDAPAASLRGQCYELAVPLACRFRPGWLAYYRQQLRQPGVNYWQWKNLPFSETAEPMLSQLLSLPQPPRQVREILESLAKVPVPLGSEESLAAFQQWHGQASQQLDADLLPSIYQVCYGINWNALSPLVGENLMPLEPAWLRLSAPWWQVLGVKPFSAPEQVEQAYKNLLRRWHPDVNSHLWASQITVRFNQAYAQYQKHHHLVSAALHPLKMATSRVVTSVEKWRRS